MCINIRVGEFIFLIRQKYSDAGLELKVIQPESTETREMSITKG